MRRKPIYDVEGPFRGLFMNQNLTFASARGTTVFYHFIFFQLDLAAPVSKSSKSVMKFYSLIILHAKARKSDLTSIVTVDYILS